MREVRQSGGAAWALSRMPSGRVGRMSGAQGGFTLIEVLISVFLIGTVVLAIAVGMLTALRSSISTSEQQRLAAGVLSYTELLRSQDYSDCAAPADFPEWDGTPGIEGRVIEVRYWNVAAGQDWAGDPYSASCGTDQGRQLLRVELELEGRRATTAEVVLRGTA